jgi:hypothetical protein
LELIRELEAQRAGVSASSGDLAELLHADERPARAELRRQIARLELELGELFTSAFPKGGVSYEIAAAGGPRMLAIGELEQLRDTLLARIRDVRGMLAGRGYVEDRNRELLERLIAEPEKYHWVRISNEDIGEPGCRHYHSRPRYGLLGMLMGWWRVRVSSGCPLAKGRRRPLLRKWPSHASGAGAVPVPGRGRKSVSASSGRRSSRRSGAQRETSGRKRPGAPSRSPS